MKTATATRELVDVYRGWRVCESKGGFEAVCVLRNGVRVTAERESLREVRQAVDTWYEMKRGEKR